LNVTHFFVSAEVEKEQLQPSDLNHPECGLKPVATLNALDGDNTMAVGTETAPSTVLMDSDNGTKGTMKRLMSVIQGSKLIKCGCKKSCSTKSCAFKAAGQFCSSHCHRGSSCRTNFDNSSLL
jgi:hypothetical protein